MLLLLLSSMLFSCIKSWSDRVDYTTVEDNPRIDVVKRFQTLTTELRYI